MRSLTVFAVIGALIGLWLTAVTTAIAVPSYGEYIISARMYENLMLPGGVGEVLVKLSPWLLWLGVALYVWLWFVVAGRLNPALTRLPFARDGKPIWAWVAWLVAGALMLIPAAIVFRALDPGFNAGDNLRVIHWIAIPVAAAVSWALLSPRAFGRFGAGALPPLQWPDVARSAGFGAVFILLFVLASKAIGTGFMAWFTVVVEGLDRNSEVSMFGMYGMLAGMVVLFGLGYAVIFGLLPAFVPGPESWRQRLSCVRPALVLLTISLAAAVIALPMLSAVHYLGSKRLVAAADLSAIQPLSLRFVKLCKDKECRVKGDQSPNPVLTVGKPITQVPTYGLMVVDGGMVPAHPDTVPALEKFVAEHRRSVLRKAAMTGAVEVYKQLWQRQDAARLWERFVQQGDLHDSTLIWQQVQLAWLVNASPINAETRALLESMSDDRQYVIGGRAAVRLAAAWARFGDMTKANLFLDRAKKANPEKYDEVKLACADLVNGYIGGQIVMPAGTEGVRVGLFRVSPDPTRKPDAQSGKPASFGSGSLVRLTDSAMLAADGRFAFQGVGSGEYTLALLIPGAKLQEKNAVAGYNVPERIVLGAAAPRRDLGSIRLTPQ